MAISESDWAEVFRHLRMRVQKENLRELDDRVMLDFGSTDDSALDVQRYLERVIRALSERSQLGYRRALDALRSGVEVEGGGVVEGIDLVFTEHDHAVYGMTKSDMSAVDNFDPLIEQLTALRTSMIQARDTE